MVTVQNLEKLWQMSSKYDELVSIGSQVKHTSKCIFINQSKYIISLLKRYSFIDCKPINNLRVYYKGSKPCYAAVLMRFVV